MTDGTKTRCATCRHWKQDKEDWTAVGVGFGECKAVRERWRIQDAAVEGMEWGDEESEYGKRRANALRAAMAYVQDGSEYHAELITGPDFFCALHSHGEEERKPTGDS